MRKFWPYRLAYRNGVGGFRYAQDRSCLHRARRFGKFGRFSAYARRLKALNSKINKQGRANAILSVVPIRQYDPETGRWMQRDPILFAGGDPNLYGYVANDPVNFVDPRGLWAFQVGGSIGGLLGPILGVGGSAESGVAISYSSQYGLQFAGYQSAGVRAGTGLYGGASLNFSLTPSAQRVGDLNGGGLTGGFDTPIFGGSVTKSGGTCGNPSMNTYTLGVGPGVIGDIYGGATGTRVGVPLTLFGGQ